MQSMLQKSGKIRALVRDLRDNYAKCDSNDQNLESHKCIQITDIIFGHFKIDLNIGAIIPFLSQLPVHPLRNIQKLQSGLQKLDSEYDKCTAIMAEGELSNYGDGFLD